MSKPRNTDAVDKNSATFNVVDGMLFFELSGRLDKSEYYEFRDEVKQYGFNWYRPDQGFRAKWSPAAEDFILAHGADIRFLEDEDDADSRHTRFLSYSTNAEARSDAAYKESNEMGKVMQGEPIKVGHHSEKRHRRDVIRVNRLTRASVNERAKSEYWERRAAATVRRAKNRLKAPQITRRIDKLEAGQRKCVRESNFKRWWKQNGSYHQSNLEYEEAPLEERTVLAVSRKHFAKTRRHWNRWYAFYELRLEYERALLAAATPLPLDQEDQVMLEKGGGVSYGGKWYEIKRVNKKSVTILGWLYPSGTWRAPREEIRQVVSKTQWQDMIKERDRRLAEEKE